MRISDWSSDVCSSDLPLAVLKEIALKPGFYIEQAAVTLRSTLLGFLLATVLGLLFGTITAYSRLFRLTLYPLILLLQGVPKVALAPVLIIFLGFGLKFQVVVIASVAFFRSEEHTSELPSL